ncbi:MAG: hypothetical protein IKO35_03230 [Elusimicrobiaceae bacterium]|nr:hypothetical protein [Elusimicrobiaceae bacterium]
MEAETLLNTISQQCEQLRTDISKATCNLQELNRRLTQIVQQLHKNIEVRDLSFADDFNSFCRQLRKQLDEQDPVWQRIRTDAHACKPADWSADLILPAKGFNSRAKTLSRACDEFTTAYDIFGHTYKNFTAAKLNVWLLTSCQNDFSNLTGKILFLAREIAKHTEQKRGHHVTR